MSAMNLAKELSVLFGFAYVFRNVDGKVVVKVTNEEEPNTSTPGVRYFIFSQGVLIKRDKTMLN